MTTYYTMLHEMRMLTLDDRLFKADRLKKTLLIDDIPVVMEATD